MIQEFVSFDGIIDKCFKMGIDNSVIATMCSLVFSRSFKYNQVLHYIGERKERIQAYQKQLANLLQIPKIVQRSQEWYDTRQNLITASDFAQALGEGKFGTQKQFFQKKCGFEPEVKLSPNTMAPLKWGVMFEQVAQNIYALRTGMTMYEFGLIRHPTKDMAGASPDSISEFGIMLEIKCPFKRKITGEIPMQYYYQIQGQLDVCRLDECDYLECEFQETDDLDTTHSLEVGVFLEYCDSPDSSSYEYGPTSNNVELVTQWISTQRPGYIIRYWKLIKYNVIRVYKDQVFIDAKMDALQQIWDTITKYRGNKNLYDIEVKKSGKLAGPNEPVKLSGYSFI